MTDRRDLIAVAGVALVAVAIAGLAGPYWALLWLGCSLLATYAVLGYVAAYGRRPRS